jgi:predicted nucleotidyltransferase
VSALGDALGTVASILGSADRNWALVGALAVSARTQPRFTRDVDVAVAVADDPDAEAMVRRFSAQGYAVFSIVEQAATKRLATARLSRQPPAGEAPVIVDLLFASSGVEPELPQQAEVIPLLAGVEVPVARTGHLLALKVLSRSPEWPQDSADIATLMQVIDAVERARAVDAARLIASRGFARGKSLETESWHWSGRARTPSRERGETTPAVSARRRPRGPACPA